MDNLETDYYKQYVGCYAKRFYSEFSKVNICKIIGFKLYNCAYFEMVIEEEEQYWDEDKHIFDVKINSRTWYWDVEDCVIITNNDNITSDERLVNTHNKLYKGYNPFLDTMI